MIPFSLCAVVGSAKTWGGNQAQFRYARAYDLEVAPDLHTTRGMRMMVCEECGFRCRAESRIHRIFRSMVTCPVHGREYLVHDEDPS